LTKWLSHYLYFFIGLITKDGAWERDYVTLSQCHKWSHQWYHSHNISHDESNMRTMGVQCIATIVKYISSVENLIETLSSSLCQLLNKEQLVSFWLGVKLPDIVTLILYLITAGMF